MKSTDNKEFYYLRQKLLKTQKQISQLLGVSLKAVQSFEQGWRNVPVHIERHMLFLWALKKRYETRPCWEIRNCPTETRQVCPAWEFDVGNLCWFINGTICEGIDRKSWTKKMKVCRKCKVFMANMQL
ncbi:MAG: two-CW domain-containing protein [Thermodesulfobacteriota bacterium]